jgi:hypothetical protein
MLVVQVLWSLAQNCQATIIFSSPNSEHQSEAIQYALLHISIIASLDALTCDQRKISIACMAISGQGLDLYNEHAPSSVTWQKFIFCTPQ